MLPALLLRASRAPRVPCAGLRPLVRAASAAATPPTGVAVSPSTAEAVRTAVAALADGRPFTASAVLADAAANPTLPPAEEAALRVTLGAALQTQGRLADARANYARAAALCPANIQAHAGLGSIAALEHKIPAAGDHFARVLALDGDNFRARMALATIARRTGKLADAAVLLAPRPSDASLPTGMQLRLEATRAHLQQEVAAEAAEAAAKANPTPSPSPATVGRRTSTKPPDSSFSETRRYVSLVDAVRKVDALETEAAVGASGGTVVAAGGSVPDPVIMKRLAEGSRITSLARIRERISPPAAESFEWEPHALPPGTTKAPAQAQPAEADAEAEAGAAQATGGGDSAGAAAAPTPSKPPGTPPRGVSIPSYGAPLGFINYDDVFAPHDRIYVQHSQRSMDAWVPGLDYNNEMPLDALEERQEVRSIFCETDKVCYSVEAPEAGILVEVMTSVPVSGAQHIYAQLDKRAPPGTKSLLPLGRYIPARVTDWVAPGGASSSTAPAPAVAATAATDGAAAASAATASAAPAPSSSEGHLATADEVAQALLASNHTVVLSGAGLSSAAPTNLRTRKELWRRFNRADRVGVWRTQPGDWVPLWELVEAFLGDAGHADLRPPPNAGHKALAALDRAGMLSAILTQNVDHTHQLAGHTVPILELHGTLERTVCATCGKVHGPARDYVRPGHAAFPPRCEGCTGVPAVAKDDADNQRHGKRWWDPKPTPEEAAAAAAAAAANAPPVPGILRPDVVLFGEQVKTLTLQAAAEQAMLADVMLVVGTAADVAPAADLPRLAARCGARIIEIKRTPSTLTDIAHWRVPQPAEEALPAIVRAMGLRME